MQKPLKPPRNSQFVSGISSLFAAMAQKKLKQEPSAYARKHFFSCSREAETLKLHAQCLSKLMKSRLGPTLSEAKRVSRFEEGNLGRDFEEIDLKDFFVLLSEQFFLKA